MIDVFRASGGAADEEFIAAAHSARSFLVKA
jgi:hypothetical protein